MKRAFFLGWLFLFSLGAVAQTAQPAPTSSTTESVLVPRNTYPGYQEYLYIMQALADRYPDRCQLENWGTLPSGRKILALRLSNNLSANSGKPRALCTAAMHGDELAGYWLMLRLAEDLLTNDDWGLLDDLEIYINPLANPDGAFHQSDQSLSRSRRGNANGVDLNRNYPDPDDGAHPDGHDYQPETRIFMRAARSHNFDIGLNIHGGAEVFNYPWDTFRNRHPDNLWWRRVSRQFARRAQVASGHSGYFNDRQNGVTNGHDWYPISGSRQDYMNYYNRCREATLEVSDIKRYPANRLLQLWTYVRGPIAGFLQEARFGLHGYVRDFHTGQAIPARIFIPGHDRQHSEVYADAWAGDFHRYLSEGIYEVEIRAEGYLPQLHEVTIVDNQRTELNVRLRRGTPFSR